MFEWWRKSFFSLFNSIIYFHWAVVIAVVVVTCCRIGWFEILHSKHEYHLFFLLFGVVVPLLFLSFSILYCYWFCYFIHPIFPVQYTVQAILCDKWIWQKEREKNEQSIQYTYIHMKLCRKFNRQRKKKHFKRIDRKSLVLLCSTVLMKRACTHTLTQFVQIMCVCPVIKQTSCEQNEKEANGSIDKLFISYD